MVDTGALWLVPGLGHPVFARFAAFFQTLFRRFEALDYRALYLEEGSQALRGAVLAATRRNPGLILYTQFPSSYAYLPPSALDDLRGDARLVGLGFDDEIYFEQAKHFYFQCDAVITSDIEDAGRLRSADVTVHLAQFQQPQQAPTGASPAEDIPVSFIGDMTKPGRKEFVDTLRSAGIEVQDFGKGSRNGRISDAEAIEMFRRSRINLNFTRTNPPDWIVRRDPARAGMGQIKGRPFDLASMGKFCLCEWAPCVSHWFQPDGEIGVFRDAAELVAAVRKYSADDTLRQRIAAAARARYRRDYEPNRQYQRIFSEILAQPKKSAASAPAWDAFFYESMGRSRAVAFLHALRRGRPLRALAETMRGESTRGSYWRGFSGGIRDTVTAQLSQR